MGKSSKPLHIMIHPSIAHWPEWETLKEQGFTITVWDPIDIDVYMGPNAWHMDEDLKKYLAVAIKSYRAKRYSKFCAMR